MYGDGIGVGDGWIVSSSSRQFHVGSGALVKSAGEVRHGEVDGAGGVSRRPVRAARGSSGCSRRMPAKRSRGHVEAAGDLVDRDEVAQGWRLGEDPVASSRAACTAMTAYGVAQVTSPISRRRSRASRIERGRRVVGDFRLQQG